MSEQASIIARRESGTDEARESGTDAEDDSDDEKEDGSTLVLLSLATGDETRYDLVADYEFAEEAAVLAFTTSTKDGSGDGAQVVPLDDVTRRALLDGNGRYEQLALTKDGAHVAESADRSPRRSGASPARPSRRPGGTRRGGTAPSGGGRWRAWTAVNRGPQVQKFPTRSGTSSTTTLTIRPDKITRVGARVSVECRLLQCPVDICLGVDEVLGGWG